MNNDISGKYNKYTSIPHFQNNLNVNQAEKILSENVVINENDVKSPMSFFGSMGVAQVQMSNPQTKISVFEFLNDEAHVNAHVEFCDDLVEKGYNLEDAIDATDKVFSRLKDEKIYKN